MKIGASVRKICQRCRIVPFVFYLVIVLYDGKPWFDDWFDPSRDFLYPDSDSDSDSDWDSSDWDDDSYTDLPDPD